MDVLQFLWQHYMEYENGWTPIHIAAAKGHTEIIFLGEPRKCVLCFGLRIFLFGRAKEVIYICNKGIFRGSLLVRVRPHR